MTEQLSSKSAQEVWDAFEKWVKFYSSRCYELYCEDMDCISNESGDLTPDEITELLGEAHGLKIAGSYYSGIMHAVKHELGIKEDA